MLGLAMASCFQDDITEKGNKTFFLHFTDVMQASYIFLDNIDIRVCLQHLVVPVFQFVSVNFDATMIQALKMVIHRGRLLHVDESIALRMKEYPPETR